MTHTLLPILLLTCVAFLILERLGLPTTLSLNFKGDVKRETRWLAQYGQFVCTAVAAGLVWQLDPLNHKLVIAIICAVLASSILAMFLKRILGRVRPGRPDAGNFTGPSWRHANFRESFPSSHSACAFALSAMLAHAYPPAAAVFWSLAVACAALRYILDAHWPSDVLGGIALGYGVAQITWMAMMKA
jgi:membrane-associated phospholipid phosphatase